MSKQITQVLGTFLKALDAAHYSLSADAHLALAELRREFYALSSAAAPSAAEPVAVGYTWIESNGTRSFAAEKTVADALTKYGVREVHPVYLAAPPAPQAASKPVELSNQARREAEAEEAVDAEDGPLLVAARKLISGSTPPRSCHGEYSVPAELWSAFYGEVLEQLRENARKDFSSHVTEAQTRASASVAGLSGDAEREALTRAQAVEIARRAAAAAPKVHGYLRDAVSNPDWTPHDWVVDAILHAALHSTGKPDAEGARCDTP